MKKYFFILIFTSFSFFSCLKEPKTYTNNYEGNFNALWEIIDTRYCFLDYKGIDWNSIYIKYHYQLQNIYSDRDFFNLLSEMLAELKDGHVNLFSSFDISRYENWFTEYPSNFNSKIIYSDKYLGKKYKIAGGMHYEKIAGGNIGYIYYGSFINIFTGGNIQYIFDYFRGCSGLIIDIRDNGGGSIVLSEQLASYFFKTRTLTGYIAHKTGSGHSDFSTPAGTYTPADTALHWDKPVAVLSNRMTYSAANDFVNRMKSAPSAIIIGDKTGGGGGMPLSSELLNGWMVRFSACPMYDKNKQHVEFGIDPDIKVNLDPDNSVNDFIIDTAVIYLLKAK